MLQKIKGEMEIMIGTAIVTLTGSAAIKSEVRREKVICID